MEEFHLDTFRDSLLIADLVVGPGTVSVKLEGNARYTLSVHCDSDRDFQLSLWTTEKGRIETILRNESNQVTVTKTAAGDLQTLDAKRCSVHFEHMDRGHYYLGLFLENGDTLYVGFLTKGYLKSKVDRNVLPGSAD